MHFSSVIFSQEVAGRASTDWNVCIYGCIAVQADRQRECLSGKVSLIDAARRRRDQHGWPIGGASSYADIRLVLLLQCVHVAFNVGLPWVR